MYEENFIRNRRNRIKEATSQREGWTYVQSYQSGPFLSNKGWTYRQIVEALFWDEETISEHVNEYQESRKLSIQTGGSQSKLNEQQTQELMKHLTREAEISGACPRDE